MGIPERTVKGQKTYSHLMSLQRKPTEYDIATSRLLYHPQRGFEVNVPAAEWYRRYQRESVFSCTDWELFADPRQTTYTSYTALQNQKEIFVGRLLHSIHQGGHDLRLDPGWPASLESTLSTVLYPLHGLQMLAAYVGQMAPASRITIAAMFQAGDEVRRIQRFAYRLRQLQLAMPDLEQVDGRRTWERAEQWQPLRALIEHLLVTYDWGEALLALNFVLKPALDELLLVDYAQQAYDCADHPMQLMCHSLNEDCQWHLRWSRALVATALRDTPAQRAALEAILERWLPLATKAVTAIATKVGAKPRPTEDVVHENWQLMLSELEAEAGAAHAVAELDAQRIVQVSAPSRKTERRRRPR